jgi:hypothetical protein
MKRNRFLKIFNGFFFGSALACNVNFKALSDEPFGFSNYRCRQVFSSLPHLHCLGDFTRYGLPAERGLMPSRFSSALRELFCKLRQPFLRPFTIFQRYAASLLSLIGRIESVATAVHSFDQGGFVVGAIDFTS